MKTLAAIALLLLLAGCGSEPKPYSYGDASDITFVEYQTSFGKPFFWIVTDNKRDVTCYLAYNSGTAISCISNRQLKAE